MKAKSILSLCGASASRHFNLMLAAALVALLGSQPALAASATWAATTNGTWATLANWASGTVSVPGSALAETATFNTNPSAAGARLISLGAGVTIRNVTFAAAAGAYTIGGGTVGSQTLTLEPASAVTVAASSVANQLFNSGIVLGTDSGGSTHTFTQNTATVNLTLAGGITGSSLGASPGIKGLTFAGGGPINASGVISNGGATTLNITKSGGGITTFTGANSYTGTTAITGGTLSVGSISALPGYNIAVRFSVVSGATLAVGNAVTDGDIATILGTGNFVSGSAIGFDTSSGARTYGVAVADLGAVSLGLTKVGTSILTLAATNTYTGPTTINGGTLSVSSIGNTGSLTSNLGTNASIVIGALASGQLVYTGSGEVTDRSISASGVNNFTSTISQSGTGVLEFTGTFTVTSANNRTLNLDGSSAGTGKFSGVISNASGFVTAVNKTGTGTWTLSGINTFTGNLTASGGTLIVDKTGTGTLAACPVVMAGGTLKILGATSGATTQTVAQLTMNSGTSTLAIDPNGGTSTTLTVTGTTASQISNGSLLFDTSAGTPATAIAAWNPALTGGIIGGTYLMKDNAGTGFATVTAGNVTRFVPSTVLDTVNPTSTSTDLLTNTTGTITNTIPAASLNSLTIDTSAGNNTWDLVSGSTAAITTGGIFMSGANNFTFDNGTLKSATPTTNSDLSINQYGGGVLTINSVIANGNGASIFNKFGPGTVLVSGANTYTGGTRISAGTLKVGSASAFTGLGVLNLSFTGTLDLNGNDAKFTNLGASSSTNTITNTGAADATLIYSALAATNNELLTDGSTNKLALQFSNANSSVTALKLDSPNTFSGGITVTGGTGSGSRLRMFNGTIVSVGSPGAIVSSPFGKGPIRLGSAAIGATDKGGLMFDTLTGTNTVLNEIIFNTELGSDNKGVRVDSTASNFTLAGDLTASLADAAFSGSGDFTISGSIKGPLGLEIGGIDNTTRTITLTAANNPYHGDTTILKGVLSVSSIANQLGTASTPIAMGATGAEVGTARLRYTGTGETTSRGVATSGVLANSAAIEQAGTGLLKFTGPFTVATANNRHLILDGSTAGTGEISGVISNGSGFQTQVTKNGSGTWTLSGANTYTRDTTVNAGTLALASTGQLKFITGATSGTGNNVLNGAGTITLDGSFVIDTATTDASALTSGSWVIENAASLPGAYGGSFTVVGWTDAGSDTWTKTVGIRNYIFNELNGTVSMVEVSGDSYTTWIDSFTPNALLPDAASKLPTADPDSDGITNLMEFVLGNGNPVISSQAILPTQATVGPNLVLSYLRNDNSEFPATTQVGQWSTNLSTWNDVTPVLVNENSAAPDDMTVTIPTTNAVDGKLFLRLKAVK